MNLFTLIVKLLQLLIDLVSMEMPFSTPSASGTEIALAPLPRGASAHTAASRLDQAASIEASLNLMQTSASSADVITPENRHDYIRQGKGGKYLPVFDQVLPILLC